MSSRSRQYFNPRTHEGCDTHSLAFSAPKSSNFNPRTHEGCDEVDSNIRLAIFVFQSTHPRGVRPWGAMYVNTPATDFNPRTHEGCDEAGRNSEQNRTSISVHAPTRGATSIPYIYALSFRISIHAPTRGATVKLHRAIIVFQISIHAPTRGATRGTSRGTRYGTIFQSTHPRGVRRPSNKSRHTLIPQGQFREP